MRVIEADLGEVRAVAVSPDGRFVAASDEKTFGTFHWATGKPVPEARRSGASEQVAFAPTSAWSARVSRGQLCLEPVAPLAGLFAPLAGGVAVSPNGKTLVATTAGSGNQAKLERWTLPALRPFIGFDGWQPFTRLGFSPNGEFLAGIHTFGFELRFAASGGIDYRHRMRKDRRFTAPGFVSFDRDSSTCAFGWADEFHLLDISTGTSKPGPRVEAQFRDAAFLPSGQHFATIGDDGRLKLWNPQTWVVVREYDWECGALTCLAFTADGSAGVCGTADGKLVQFDVDE